MANQLRPTEELARSLRRNVNVAFAVAILLPILVGVVSYRSALRSSEAARARRQSLDMADRLAALLAHLQDAETGQRGYLLTGREPDLEPFTRGSTAVARDFAALARLTAADSLQRLRLSQVAPLARAKLAELDQSIQRRRQGGFAAALPVVTSDRVRLLTDRVRQVIATMDSTETARALERDAQLARASRMTRLLIIAGSVLAVILVAGALALVRFDIIARERAERALRESEQRVRLMVENVKDYAIFLLDPNGNVMSWNIGAEGIKGYRADEILGQHFSRFYTPEDVLAGRPQHELAAASTVGRVEDEGWRVRKDGSRFWANVMITALYDPDGHLVGFGKVTRDMTERKLALEELAQSNAELEGFSYSVSHDLRAPLRAIDGFSRILLEEHAPALDPEAQRLLGVIRTNAQRMGRLIDDLLNFARLGRKELDRGTVNLTALVQEVVDELRRAEGGAEVEVVIGSLPETRGDRDLLRQAFANLVGNAFKFTRHRTQRHIEVGGRSVAGETCYWVKDNGVGFDMRYADKLFGVFQRLHREDEFEGTGVGLALVQRIVLRHGGRIWADGRVGEGATFYLTLPGRPVAAPTVPVPGPVA